ncbi:hypothetical protein [Burkholderia territorii]|uniref:hypothetical protein n=1 Tax=Burkholderia territorii TaxID=1503055 RepID=UPI000A63D6AE|nr:hypothetical protein [Burkholderia territorii]
MKHIDDVRLVATGSALRHTGRVHAPRTHAGVAPVARVAEAPGEVAHRNLSWRHVMQPAGRGCGCGCGHDRGRDRDAVSRQPGDDGRPARGRDRHPRRPAFVLRCVAHVRAATAMPSPARRRPLSSVRLTLMQDHSS